MPIVAAVVSTGRSAADASLEEPDMLQLVILSVAELATKARIAGIGRAFDSQPELRPLRIGPGAPIRTRVDGSMERALLQPGLDLDWLLMVRRTSPFAEFGELKIHPGHGNFYRRMTGEEIWEPHEIRMDWSAAWIRRHHAEEAVAGLLIALCQAGDAFLGSVRTARHSSQWAAFQQGSEEARSEPEYELGDVAWLNYFGPAFFARYPGLNKVPGARLLDFGGVLIRTTGDPWNFDPSAARRDSYPWKLPVLEAMGRREGAQHGPTGTGGSGLPTLREHLREVAGAGRLPDDRLAD